MKRRPEFAFVVFATAFAANVIVVALWPDSDVDWATALVTAAAV